MTKVQEKLLRKETYEIGDQLDYAHPSHITPEFIHENIKNLETVINEFGSLCKYSSAYDEANELLMYLKNHPALRD